MGHLQVLLPRMMEISKDSVLMTSQVATPARTSTKAAEIPDVERLQFISNPTLGAHRPLRRL